MGEIVNLNQYRKALRRLDKAQKSTENRVKFGRLKFEKEASNCHNARKIRHLDMAKIEHVPVPLLADKTQDATSNPPRAPDSPGKGT